jgi:hypothetical protein
MENNIKSMNVLVKQLLKKIERVKIIKIIGQSERDRNS